MKRILMRGGMSPFDSFDPYDTIMKDTIGGNCGNMLFLYSMFRTLMTGETGIDTNYYKLNLSACDEINEKYSAFVIPLADAFRPNFGEMTQLISFVKKLKIPCVVTGVGVSMPFEPDFSRSYNFDDQSREFCKAVLEKSASIGVRGGVTARYLEKLGFKNHIRVIGCPSMFLNGNHLGIKDKGTLKFDSKVCFNAAKGCYKNIWKFMDRNFALLSDYYFLPQGMYDLKLIYAGEPSKGTDTDYPCNLSHFLVKENRMRFFVNVKSWLEFLSQMDFSVGIKIHGTIAAIQAGVPSFLFAIDSRTRELAEYHNIPYMDAAAVDEKMNIFNLYDNTDFDRVRIGHEERLNRFISFLDENGLDHIDIKQRNTAFDEKMQELQFYPAVESILHVDMEEQAKRLNLYYGHLNRKIDNLKKRLADR